MGEISQYDVPLLADMVCGLEAEQASPRAKVDDTLTWLKLSEVQDAIADGVEGGFERRALRTPTLLVEPARPLV
jgi:hypothetical protein